MNKKTNPVPQINPTQANPLVNFEEEDVKKNLKTIKRKELKIVFFGSRGFVIPVIDAIKEEFNLLAIVTVPDQPVGRNYKLTPTPVKDHFLSSGVLVFDPEKLDENFAKTLADLEPDLFVVAAYGNLIPNVVLNIPKYGALNLHPSLLPKYRGPSPIQNAVLNGDEETGMSYMLLDAKMDHGPILYQSHFKLSDTDTFESVGDRIFLQASEEIVDLIKKYTSKQLSSKEQDHDQATFTKLLKKEDGYFEIDNPPSLEQLDRMIRAYYPWPNAWTRWNGKVVKLYPGGLIQMEGKKAVKFKDFLNGYPDFPLKKI